MPLGHSAYPIALQTIVNALGSNRMPKSRIALLLNLVAPTRVGVYERLAERLELTILHGGMEGDRCSWRELPNEGASVRRVSGWQLLLTKSDRGREIDSWVLLMPGYVAELIREKPDANSSVELEETSTGR